MLNVEAKWSKFRCFGKGIVVAVRAASREAKRIDATNGLSHQGDSTSHQGDYMREYTSHQGDCLDGIDEECITPARLGLKEAAMKEGKKAGMLVQKVS